MRRNALLGTLCAAAVLSGAGVLGAGPADALSADTRCVAPTFSNFYMCAVDENGDDSVSTLFAFGNPEGTTDFFIGQDRQGGGLNTGADIDYEGWFFADAAQYQDGGGSGIAAEVRGRDRADGSSTSVSLDLYDSDNDGQEFGAVGVSQHDSAGDVFTGLVWEDDECSVVLGSNSIMGCPVQFVPGLPVIPYVNLP